MNLKPLTTEQVTKLFTLEELTAMGEGPNSEMFGRILTKAVIAQRDQDQEVMTALYEALKLNVLFINAVMVQYPEFASDYEVQMLRETNDHALAKAGK